MITSHSALFFIPCSLNDNLCMNYYIYMSAEEFTNQINMTIYTASLMPRPLFEKIKPFKRGLCSLIPRLSRLRLGEPGNEAKVWTQD